MSPDLIAAAEAYRSERERYWIRKRKVGQSTSPGGSTAVWAMDVLDEVRTVVYSGPEDQAKAWLDQTCLAAALRRLLSSGDLRAEAGAETLHRIKVYLGL